MKEKMPVKITVEKFEYNQDIPDVFKYITRIERIIKFKNIDPEFVEIVNKNFWDLI